MPSLFCSSLRLLVFMAFTSVIALLGLAMLEDQFDSRAIAHIVGPNFDLSVLVGTIIIAALSLAWAVYRNGFLPAGMATDNPVTAACWWRHGALGGQARHGGAGAGGD